ncbi:MAG: hypothetical protein Ct9H300mP18_09180 [Candidatus Neomarinimicrobiota bacterium]|nr:MAG: hypothetical protein Ct9H300mP18_09180 [Candidatus Neomarinimicrobiota bacterium]
MGGGKVIAISDSMQKAAIPVDIHIEKFFDVPIVKNVLSGVTQLLKIIKLMLHFIEFLNNNWGKNGQENSLNHLKELL